MIRTREQTHDDANRPDLEVRFALLENDYPDTQWSPATRQLMLDGLYEMDQRNGERPHHDSLHPLTVTREAYDELQERAGILNYGLTPLDYEALGLAGMYHDIDMDTDDKSTPEERSAAYIQAKMREFGPHVYSEAQVERVGHLIIATTAQYVGDKVLQPMATKIPPDFCAPSIIYGDVGEVTHSHWTHVLLSMGRVAAEGLMKLLPGEDPLKKVMGIFDKQDSFSDQRFEDWPEIVQYHCGDENAVIYLKAKEEQRSKQRRIVTEEYLNKLPMIRADVLQEFPSIIGNTEMSYHDKADAFFRAVMNLLSK